MAASSLRTRYSREVEHQGYLIRTVKEKGGSRAQAFPQEIVGRPRSDGRTRRPPLEAQAAATVDEAVVLVRDQIDARAEAFRAARTLVDGAEVPGADEFEEALLLLDLTPAEANMLVAHAEAPDRRLSSEEIAQAGGYERSVSASSQYGALGRKVIKKLKLTVQGARKNASEVGASVLAQAMEPDAQGRPVWRMHETLAEAMKRQDMI